MEDREKGKGGGQLIMDNEQWTMPAWRAAAALLALLLAGCGTNGRRAREWAYANRDATAAWCADLFPVRETAAVRGRTVLLPGRAAVTAVDTLRLRAPCPDGTEAECPPAITRTVTVTDTLLRVDTVRVRDRAAETVLAAQKEAIARRLDDASAGRDAWRRRALWALAAAAALLLWRAMAGK